MEFTFNNAKPTRVVAAIDVLIGDIATAHTAVIHTEADEEQHDVIQITYQAVEDTKAYSTGFVLQADLKEMMNGKSNSIHILEEWS